MKKLHLITILLMSAVLLLSACSGRSSYPMAMPTAMPIRVEHIDISDRDEDSNNDKDITPQDALQEEVFESLRQAFHDAMIYGLIPNPEDSENPIYAGELEHNLLDYADDTIIVAYRFVGWPFTDGYGETPKEYNDISLPENSEIQFIAANEFNLVDGKLIDKGLTYSPVLITTNQNSSEIEHIYLPEMYDEVQRAEDMKNIFGEYTDLLSSQISDYRFAESSRQINTIQYHTALSGGFDSFPNEIVDILKSLNKGGYLDNSTIEGAARMHFVENGFSYSSITLPFWHEFGRSTDVSSPVLYTGMYFGEISKMGDGTLMTSSYFIPNRVGLISEDNTFSVWPFGSILSLETDLDEYIEEGFGDYADAYYDFYQSKEYHDFIFFCDSVIDDILNDSFDYNEDVLPFSQ